MEADQEEEQASKVTIKRIERNKRKFITGVHGLEAFGAFSAGFDEGIRELMYWA